ncbi:unnamed protein product [Gongylonema pulchrum]|uniref:Tudor domain-containing protein n=1 Tax=Gongylonema pulchrum TaxID=637853 RepID=A0A183D2H5_9BILA|nr:unnamed protein product [Gongylonema pulchrum]
MKLRMMNRITSKLQKIEIPKDREWELGRNKEMNWSTRQRKWEKPEILIGCGYFFAYEWIEQRCLSTTNLEYEEDFIAVYDDDFQATSLHFVENEMVITIEKEFRRSRKRRNSHNGESVFQQESTSKEEPDRENAKFQCVYDRLMEELKQQVE